MSRKPDWSAAGVDCSAMCPSMVCGDSGIASLAIASRSTFGRLVQPASATSSAPSSHTTMRRAVPGMAWANGESACMDLAPRWPAKRTRSADAARIRDPPYPVFHMPVMRLWLMPAVLAVACLLAGCAGLPPLQAQPPSTAIPASRDTDLGARAAQAVAEAAVPADQSGFLPIPQALVALDARLTLIRRAQRSLDLQYYLLGNDEVGHLVLRELRDAAARGVR